MKPQITQYAIYNYLDFFSKYFFIDQSTNTSCPDHALVFVISGELTVRCSCGSTTLSEGGYIFLRKDENTILERRSSGEKPFRSVFMGFNRCFLQQMRPMLDNREMSQCSSDFENNVIALPKKPSLESLYISLLPYLEWKSCPEKQLLEIKLMEAVYSLIQMDERFYSCLFDFDEPTEENHKTEEQSYNKLLMDSYYVDRQMNSSYITLTTDGQVTDVYLDVTYQNVARFFNAFGQGLVFDTIN